jgi:hypothetical protein
VLIETGLQEVCSGLINFLTAVLVLPMEDREVPVTVWAQAGHAGYLPVPVAISYRHACVLSRDLPCLRPISRQQPTASDPALIDVA